MTTQLQLFTSPSAFPNPQRLRLFMHEKGIADQFAETIYDMTPVGEQRGWRHLKMNPWGETPTLQLADVRLAATSGATVAAVRQASAPAQRLPVHMCALNRRTTLVLCMHGAPRSA